MIDVWMLFTMMYPFTTVSLYALIEVLSRSVENDVCIISKDDTSNETKYNGFISKIKIFLDFFLPLIAVVFICTFFGVGISKQEHYNDDIDC